VSRFLGALRRLQECVRRRPAQGSGSTSFSALECCLGEGRARAIAREAISLRSRVPIVARISDSCVGLCRSHAWFEDSAPLPPRGLLLGDLDFVSWPCGACRFARSHCSVRAALSVSSAELFNFRCRSTSPEIRSGVATLLERSHGRSGVTDFCGVISGGKLDLWQPQSQL
jgi:hypothetical protein